MTGPWGRSAERKQLSFVLGDQLPSWARTEEQKTLYTNKANYLKVLGPIYFPGLEIF